MRDNRIAMRRPIPERDRQAALDLLRRGQTAVAAARETGVNVNTIRSWKARERIAGAHLRVLPEVDTDVPLPSREELLRRLDQQSRAGRVTATVALLKLTPEEPPAEPPLGELYALADRIRAEVAAEDAEKRPV